jgi:hypothetical protein
MALVSSANIRDSDETLTVAKDRLCMLGKRERQGSGKFLKEELNGLYSSPNINPVIKWRRMR